jgi:hypothetical protein
MNAAFFGGGNGGFSLFVELRGLKFLLAKLDESRATEGKEVNLVGV